MRRSKAATADTRQRIVGTAAREFRRYGIQSLSVVELMAHAGLTHGGFYKHFASKEALAAEACRHALGVTAAEIEAAMAQAPAGRKLAAVVDVYLSSQHRDYPESGCAVAALSGEVARIRGPVRQAVADGHDLMVGLVAAALPELPDDERQSRARAIVATLVGAVITARLVPDRAVSTDILRSARALILGAFA